MVSTVAQLVEPRTRDRRVACSRLTTGIVTVVGCLVLVQTRKTGNRPYMTEKLLTASKHEFLWKVNLKH